MYRPRLAVVGQVALGGGRGGDSGDALGACARRVLDQWGFGASGVGNGVLLLSAMRGRAQYGVTGEAAATALAAARVAVVDNHLPTFLACLCSYLGQIRCCLLVSAAVLCPEGLYDLPCIMKCLVPACESTFSASHWKPAAAADEAKGKGVSAALGEHAPLRGGVAAARA